MADDLSVKLDGGRFDRVSVTSAELWAAEFTDTRFRNSDFVRVVMRGVTLADVDIDGQIDGLTINGVDVGPLITAELDRRYPDRAKMRPTDPAGFREAWDIVERLWQGTVDRARRLDPELLHESVDGEWSFIETLRHLSHATDCWVRRAIFGEPTPWDPWACRSRTCRTPRACRATGRPVPPWTPCSRCARTGCRPYGGSSTK
jgi:hypothetical protein